MKSSFTLINANILIGICTLFILVSCGQTQVTKNEGEMSIKNAMREQMNSWNDGDIPAFMNYYWKSDSLQFVSKNGISYGWNKVITNYQKAYPTKEKMGELLFELKEVNQVSNDCVYVVGTWNLAYESQPNVGGFFTLIWKLKPEGWRIVIDHTS